MTEFSFFFNMQSKCVSCESLCSDFFKTLPSYLVTLYITFTGANIKWTNPFYAAHWIFSFYEKIHQINPPVFTLVFITDHLWFSHKKKKREKKDIFARCKGGHTDFLFTPLATIFLSPICVCGASDALVNGECESQYQVFLHSLNEGHKKCHPVILLYNSIPHIL